MRCVVPLQLISGPYWCLRANQHQRNTEAKHETQKHGKPPRIRLIDAHGNVRLQKRTTPPEIVD